jgi:CDP-4-dehydro-6-deoxyglucose reductase
MPVITLANGTHFSADPGRTMLDAAAAQGLVLPHSCRTGRCGACKVLVKAGSVALLRDALALSVAELASGWALTCAHSAVTDVRLDLADLGPLANIPAKTLPARIAHLDRVAPDVLLVQLRLPPRAGYRFVAGQSIDITSPTGVRRSYSLASSPDAPDRLELHIRQVKGGRFSEYWFGQAKLDDLLRFQGPRGTFFLRPCAGADLVFLATGTGVAPIKSMLSQLSAMPPADQPASVALYWGGRSANDLYWSPHQALPALRYVPVLSRADAAWQGARGHVQNVLLSSRPSLARAVVYACGSEAMIASASRALAAAGLAPQQFFYDAFVSADTAPSPPMTRAA